MNVLSVHELFAASQIAVFGYTVFVIMTEPGKIFSFHKQRLEWFECGGNYFKPPLSYTKVPWRCLISKPLGSCEVCATGQLSLWFYVFSHLNGIDPVRLFLFTASSIFTIKIIDKCLKR